MPIAPAEPATLRYRTAYRYTGRADKARYIAEKYAPVLAGSVLDVGCDRAPLRSFIHAPATYTGVDILPDAADLVVNLDRDPLPLPDRAFDTVLCTDVLEHLESIHATFAELCRVARTHVVISLPNPLRNVMIELAHGGPPPLRKYGLPLDPPTDRHRWFFSSTQAEHFVETHARRHGFSIEQLDFEESGWPASMRDHLRRVLPDAEARGTMWALLRRDATAAPARDDDLAWLGQPRPALTPDQYVELQLAKTRTMTTYDPGPRAQALLEFIRRHGAPTGVRVLAVGARNGHELDHLARAGYPDAIGIDLLSVDPRIRVMDMQKMSFPDARFDLVYASHCLEHALDPRRAADEFVRVCVPGGLIAIEVPIGLGRVGPDLWDLQSPAGVARLFHACAVVASEELDQIGATRPQRAARILLRTPTR